MKDNLCLTSEISDFDYCHAQIETGIHELEFENPKQNPWPEYKYFVRVGGGYRGFSSKRDARKYYNGP